jgi:signal transduction histidine kinase
MTQPPGETRPNDAIAKWAADPSTTQSYPDHGWMLRFSDAALESNYRQRSFAEQHHAIQLNIGITILFLLLFLAIDPLLLHADLLKTFRLTRLGVLIPLSIAALLACHYITHAQRWVQVCMVSIVPFGLCWTGLLMLGGGEIIGYLSLALIQTIVGTFFLLGLPVRLSIPAAALYTGTFLVTAFVMDIPIGIGLTHTLGCVTVAMVCAFGAFRSEKASRHQFVAQAMSDAQYFRSLAIQDDRNRWLEVFASFLRHELKNSMVGISSSIELAQRAVRQEQPQQREYLDRATQSLGFMRRLLGQVAEATSLETALSAQEREPLNLSELVSGRTQDLRIAAPAWNVDAHIAPQLWVHGNPDALVQMLDKLIDNALEHGDSTHPLIIELQRDERDAVLTIADRGEPLDQDVESLFQPFLSNKRRTSESINLGLGLFVARTIATRHAGSVEAARLDDPPGAVFRIRLPLHIASVSEESPVQPTIPAAALG